MQELLCSGEIIRRPLLRSHRGIRQRLHGGCLDFASSLTSSDALGSLPHVLFGTTSRCRPRAVMPAGAACCCSRCRAPSHIACSTLCRQQPAVFTGLQLLADLLPPAAHAPGPRHPACQQRPRQRWRHAVVLKQALSGPIRYADESEARHQATTISVNESEVQSQIEGRHVVMGFAWLSPLEGPMDAHNCLAL